MNQNSRISTSSRIAGGVLALGLVAAACATDGSDTAAEPDVAVEADGVEAGDAATGEAAISVFDFDFSGDMTVAPGTTIVVTNDDSTAHTLTAVEGAFDTGNLNSGESFTITAPTEPGEYAFFCSIHPSMTGTLTVEA